MEEGISIARLQTPDGKNANLSRHAKRIEAAQGISLGEFRDFIFTVRDECRDLRDASLTRSSEVPTLIRSRRVGLFSW
jgi:hypothetical protein